VRAYVLFSILTLGFALVVARSIQLVVVPNEKLVQFARSKDRIAQQGPAEDLIVSRGEIRDRHGRPLALSVVTRSFFANPKLIKNPQATARKLAPLLKVPVKNLTRLLNEDRFFVWLKREVDETSARKIMELNLAGVYSRKESKRLYPQGELARTVLGIAGRDGVGLEGIEKAFDSHLRTSDKASGLGYRDALGRLLLFRDFDQEWFESPAVVTTLDARIQRMMEQELAQTVKDRNASSGQAVLMDPRTGAIYAMATVEGSRGDKNPLRNRVIADMYEPGSTFKVFLAAAGMEHLGMKATSQVYAEQGLMRVGNRSIREFHGKKYEWLSLQELLEVSSNIASAKIGIKMGASAFEQTLKRFGLGQPSGLGLPGEASGLLRKASDWKPIDLANISFGQGVAVTPLQLARAMAAVANGGIKVTPTVVSEVVGRPRGSQENHILWQHDPQPTRVFPSQKSRELTDMLVHVTKEGSTGRAAAIEGYSVAGKTGTAQKLVETVNSRGQTIRSYSRDASIVSFLGFVPAYDPAFVLLVLYDDPQEGRASGGNTAAPSWRRIASRALGLLGVPQEKNLPPVAQRILPSRRDAQAPSDSHYIGRSFREVLESLQKLSPEERAQYDLIGYGVATREQTSPEGKTLIFFE
jgi:cell division protein FtsI (penicillin-binding protein 3)